MPYVLCLKKLNRYCICTRPGRTCAASLGDTMWAPCLARVWRGRVRPAPRSLSSHQWCSSGTAAPPATQQKLNSWTDTFVEISGHNLKSSQTWVFRVQCLHYKPVSNHFCSGGGGRWLWIARRKTLKTFVPITSKNLTSLQVTGKGILFHRIQKNRKNKQLSVKECSLFPQVLSLSNIKLASAVVV